MRKLILGLPGNFVNLILGALEMIQESYTFINLRLMCVVIKQSRFVFALTSRIAWGHVVRAQLICGMKLTNPR